MQDTRLELTSLCIVDAQSVQNASAAEEKGYDAGKKVSGIKRHIAVDTNGLLHAIHITTANVTDRAGAIAMFQNHAPNLSKVENVLVDGAYTGKPFAKSLKSILGATVEVVKRNELHTFKVLPKRWVVVCSFCWVATQKILNSFLAHFYFITFKRKRQPETSFSLKIDCVYEKNNFVFSQQKNHFIK